jgi:serine/threonine protein kinase
MVRVHLSMPCVVVNLLCEYRELMNQCTTPETLPMSDIFSLGVAMYEIARAKPVRHDSSIQETLRSGVAPPIPGVSSEFMDLLQSMVARNPVERLSAAGILAHPALEGVKCIPSHFRELSRAPSSLPSKPSYLQLEARVRVVVFATLAMG